MMNATYSPEDNKLRLYSTTRLDAETYARVKATGFIWAPKQELFVAPMWTPEREELLLELCDEIGDEDTSLVDRAEQRAERFENYSERRAADADTAKVNAERIMDGIPLGQPILVGHHSERHARKDAEKIRNGIGRAVKLWEESKYWKERAAGAIRLAKYKERPDVRARRVKGLESEKRKQERSIKESQTLLEMWTRPDKELTLERALAIANHDHIHKRFSLAEYPRQPGASTYEDAMSLWSALGGGSETPIITPEQAREIAVRVHGRGIAHANRWLAHISNRVEYERAMLADSGGLAAERFKIELGGRVLVRGEWLTVLRINRTDGAIVSVTTNARYVPVVGIEKVRDYQAPNPEEAATVQAANKLPPMCNYPGEGFEQITREQWDKTYKDYKGSRIVEANEKHGAHRVRSRVQGYKGTHFVFLTDSKRVDPPPPALLPAPEPVKIAPPTPDPASPPPRRYAEPEPTAFDFMRETLKAGVRVVTADQLFPTPRDLAARMVDLADVQPNDSVLEPSAGTGRLVDALDAIPGAEVIAVEISPTLADNLRLRSCTKHKIHCADFLTCNGTLGAFDVVLMNPPFVNGQDIQHIKHALTFLKPGGRLVAICANGPRQERELRPMIEAAGGLWEPLPAGTFAGTGVHAVLMTYEKEV